MSEQTFDPAAEFLLGMGWPNLFEQADAGGMTFRCKGCREIVRQGERETHFNHHLGIRKRSETMRKKRIERERLERLALAREAKRA